MACFPTLDQNAQCEPWQRQFALTRVWQSAYALHHVCCGRVGRSVATIEEQAITLGDTRHFGASVKARGGCLVAMAYTRTWTKDHSPAFLPGAHTPLDVFPVERVVAADIGYVTSQRLGTKQRGTAAPSKVRPIGGVLTRVGMRDVDACTVGVPIDEPGLLAPTIGAFLHDLRSDREDVGLAALGEEWQRRRLQGDVVVHQERPVVASALQSAR